MASGSQSLFRGIFELIIEESGGERSDDKGRKKKPLTNSPFSLLQFYFPSLPPSCSALVPIIRFSRFSLVSSSRASRLSHAPREALGKPLHEADRWKRQAADVMAKDVTLEKYFKCLLCRPKSLRILRLQAWSLVLSATLMSPSLYFLLVCIYSLFVYYLLCVCYCRQQYSALEYVFDLSATRIKYLYLYIYICKQQLKALPELHISQVTGHQYNILSACAVHRPFFLYEAHLPDLSVHWLPEKNNEI